MIPTKSRYAGKLTPADVDAIRMAPLETSHAALAREFGVAAATVGRIRRGTIWRERTHEALRVQVPLDVWGRIERAAKAKEMAPHALAAAIVLRALTDATAEVTGVARR